jgi:hydroxyacylglutathione hydrolase
LSLGGLKVKMRLVLLGLFALLVGLPATVAAGGNREAGDLVTPRQAEKLVSSGEAVLVDVRDEASYVSGHVAGALHVPLPDVAAQASAFARDGRTVITYCSCPAEETSLAAAGRLIAEGFTDVLVLRGGIAAWAEAGLPINRGPRP